VQHGHPLRHLADEGDVVLDHDDGEPGPVQVLEHAGGLQRLLGREPGRGLVQQQDVGPAAQHHGDLQPLEAMVRQLARRPVALGLETEQLQGMVEPLLGRPVDLVGTHRDGEVLVDGERVIGAVGLEGQPQALPHTVECRQARDVPALQQDAAPVRPVDAAEKGEEGGLAGPVRADDATELTRRHGERHLVGGNHAPEAFGKGFGRQDRLRHLSRL
jgi:hypothetical protein